MKVIKRISMVFLSLSLILSICTIGAFAETNVQDLIFDSLANSENRILVTGEPGTTVDLGGGFKCIIMDDEMVEETMIKNGDNPNARITQTLWNLTSMTHLGRAWAPDLPLNGNYKYFRVYFKNNQSSSQVTSLGVYNLSGQELFGPVDLYGGDSYFFYNDTAMTGDYYVGYYTASGMANYLDGETSCYRAYFASEVN